MSAAPHMPLKRASLPALIAGFASIYLIWGSTYLAIKFVVHDLPPFITAGARFFSAGAVLWSIARINMRRLQNPLPLRAEGQLRGENPPSFPWFTQFRHAAIAGIFMLTGGNGLVCWSQQSVDSGIAALVVGTMPISMVLLEWLLYRSARPNLTVWLGLALGFGGVAILAVLTMKKNEAPAQASWGIIALVCATFFWAYGSLYARRVDQGPSLLQAAAMQMLGGGAVLLLVGTLLGEWGAIDSASLSARAILSLLYLVIVGSLIAFTTYIWLLQVASPAAVSTYAYVNPVVAVFLGWWLANETITPWTILAAILVIAAVILMTLRSPSRRSSNIPAPSLGAEQRPGMAMPRRCLNR